jgi:hypothetical protein
MGSDPIFPLAGAVKGGCGCVQPGRSARFRSPRYERHSVLAGERRSTDGYWPVADHRPTVGKRAASAFTTTYSTNNVAGDSR